MKPQLKPVKPVTAEDYDEQVSDLRPRLLAAHAKLRTANSAVLIHLGGVDGAGKGAVVRLINDWLDPRGVSTVAFDLATDEEQRRPPMWRYWQALPARGRIGLFFGSWYRDIVVERVSGELKRKVFERRMDRINALERTLVAENTLVLKLWLHIGKDEVRRRLEHLEENPELHWRWLPKKLEPLEFYRESKEVSEELLSRTNTRFAPWHMVEASEDRMRNLAVGRLLLDTLEAALRLKSPSQGAKPAPIPKTLPKRRLATVDLSHCLDDDWYGRKLERNQHRLADLSWKLADSRRSLLCVFEGWDGAGKGGAIRRLVGSLDPRLFNVASYAAPTDEERAHHYLWRFWRHLPRPGRIAIFDRSHYGRVLVERVEGFASDIQWKRAYPEINDFEQQLVESKIVVCKFWLHISPEEQLKRFKKREEVPFKRYKITPDDWRNRGKWNAHEAAVEDMLQRTHTVSAPWTVVPANDKNFARIEVLKTVVRELEKVLE